MLLGTFRRRDERCRATHTPHPPLPQLTHTLDPLLPQLIYALHRRAGLPRDVVFDLVRAGAVCVQIVKAVEPAPQSGASCVGCFVRPVDHAAVVVEVRQAVAEAVLEALQSLAAAVRQEVAVLVVLRAQAQGNDLVRRVKRDKE